MHVAGAVPKSQLAHEGDTPAVACRPDFFTATGYQTIITNQSIVFFVAESGGSLAHDYW
jgi:hypothetical protein